MKKRSGEAAARGVPALTVSRAKSPKRPCRSNRRGRPQPGGARRTVAARGRGLDRQRQRLLAEGAVRVRRQVVVEEAARARGVVIVAERDHRVEHLGPFGGRGSGRRRELDRVLGRGVDRARPATWPGARCGGRGRRGRGRRRRGPRRWRHARGDGGRGGRGRGGARPDPVASIPDYRGGAAADEEDHARDGERPHRDPAPGAAAVRAVPSLIAAHTRRLSSPSAGVPGVRRTRSIPFSWIAPWPTSSRSRFTVGSSRRDP